MYEKKSLKCKGSIVLERLSGECIENPHNHDGLPKETVTNDI